MGIRIAVVVALLALGILALHHSAPRPAIVAQSALPEKTVAPRRSAARPEEIVVYVAGAVLRPGLYRVRSGDRAADAVEHAGGMAGNADASAVNLAQRAQDGDEIYVPLVGESRHVSSSATHHRSRRSASPPPEESVDVNRADARELTRVPGIGRSVAARIVALREREGSFASLDELLDVAGMTQSRLERARPYLRQP